MTRDVYAACDKLEASGVRFQKKPDDGRMKGLAFVLGKLLYISSGVLFISYWAVHTNYLIPVIAHTIQDPDGYWIEVISRDEKSSVMNEYTLAQTMIRVKDPAKSLRFYCELLGMTKIKESVYSDFSLYFLAHLSAEDAAVMDPRMIYPPVLELTHNHGTESNPAFR